MFGKIFTSMFTGSMRGKGDLQIVWTYMIANASADGICDFMPQCIADATGKPLDLINRCIEELESPDPLSRTVRDSGRRIRKLDENRPWGWQIVNHEMYRTIACRDAMREAERLRKSEYRKGHVNKCPGQVPDRPGHSAYESSLNPTPNPNPEGDARGVKSGSESSLRYTLEDCRTAAMGVGMPDAMIEAFFTHYAAVGFVDGAGRDITSLPHALAKWKANQPSHLLKQGKEPDYKAKIRSKTMTPEQEAYFAGDK
jgi:hypothetical protein